MAVKIQDNTAVIQAKIQTNVPLAIRFMLNDIKREAEPNTPKQFGNLRANVLMETGTNSGRITWGQKYAIYQERGTGMRKYTTPGTGPNFARNAVAKVTSRAIIYFKQAGIA